MWTVCNPALLKSNAELKVQRVEQARERVLRAVTTVVCLTSLIAALMMIDAEKNFSAALVLYLISYLSGGFFPLRSAAAELREGSVNVELLMICAAAGAACVGEIPEGAILLFLFSLSGTLEQFILGKTRRAIEELMDLAPAEAVVLRGGAEVRVPVEELNVGDIILVKPGEKISGDGVIVSGSTTVDQSAMTGESIPVERRSGDHVFAGTLNQDGAIQVEVQRRANETTLARIVQLVEEARSERADSQRFTDWFGERYTYLVLAGATATGLVCRYFFGFGAGESFYRALTVLVVASPCAVVISIPAAILSAIAAAAKSGVLFKGGAHLERMAGIRAIAFDKTGTLTIGKPEVKSISAIAGTTKDELLRLAASAESQSEHPLAKAIVKHARDQNLQLEQPSSLQSVPGCGVSAEIGSRKIYVGKIKLFEQLGIPVTPEFITALGVGGSGHTEVLIGGENGMLGIIALGDVLRDSAKNAVKELRALGIEKLMMLTGDNAAAAKSAAGELGVEFAADLMPEDKVKFIKELRDRYGSVAMIGDGINDAPSLATATLGISLGTAGTAVTLETADVVLMADNLSGLPYAIELGRRTLRIIKQNLFFAFAVMLCLLAGAFSGHLRLPEGVLWHEGSTVLVILNGLRLLRRH